MKIAFYMENDLEQIVLTPESKYERDMLGKLHDGTRVLSIKRGRFFENVAGFVRHDTIDESTMLILRSKERAAALEDQTA
jgi:uncharacterized protein with PhoU and TrkA domain